MTDPQHTHDVPTYDPHKAALRQLGALEAKVAALPAMRLPPIIMAELASAILAQIQRLEDRVSAMEAGSSFTTEQMETLKRQKTVECAP